MGTFSDLRELRKVRPDHEVEMHLETFYEEFHDAITDDQKAKALDKFNSAMRELIEHRVSIKHVIPMEGKKVS